jgi:hypothetical protein
MAVPVSTWEFWANGCQPAKTGASAGRGRPLVLGGANSTTSTRSSSASAGEDGADRTGFPPVGLLLSISIGLVTGFALFVLTKSRRSRESSSSPRSVRSGHSEGDLAHSSQPAWQPRDATHSRSSAAWLAIPRGRADVFGCRESASGDPQANSPVACITRSHAGARVCAPCALLAPRNPEVDGVHPSAAEAQFVCDHQQEGAGFVPRRPPIPVP